MSHSTTPIGDPSASMRPEHGTWPGRRRVLQFGTSTAAASASFHSTLHVDISGLKWRCGSKSTFEKSKTQYFGLLHDDAFSWNSLPWSHFQVMCSRAPSSSSGRHGGFSAHSGTFVHCKQIIQCILYHSTAQVPKFCFKGFRTAVHHLISVVESHVSRRGQDSRSSSSTSASFHGACLGPLSTN